jgi:AraC-like DNA-binding protein
LQGLNAYADCYLDKSITDKEISLIVRNIYNTFNPSHHISPPPLHSNISENLPSFEMQVRNRIIDHYKKSPSNRSPKALSVTEMARHFNITTRTFQRRMEKHTGTSLSNFCYEIRLQKSRSLLAGNFSVSEISELMGFSSPSHFSREFKKTYGITPSKYKQEIRSLLR